MAGEKDLAKLLSTMKPKLNAGEYVFHTTRDIAQFDLTEIVSFFREEEGITVVLKREVADRLRINYDFVASWITLTVHSSLEAVGLTAAFSKVLMEENISCNVIAGYFHDHIFVDTKDADKAMRILSKWKVES